MPWNDIGYPAAANPLQLFAENESEADPETPEGLVHLLADVVSKNGNLLLNVGPTADGTVPAAQVTRLQAMGAWLAVNGEAIFGTHPWVRAEGSTGDGTPVRFTTSGDGGRLFAIVLGPLPAGEITLVGLAAATGPARLLGTSSDLAATPSGADLRIAPPPSSPAQAAHVFALSAPAGP